MPHDDQPLASPIQLPEPPARSSVSVESTNGFRPPGYDELPGPSNAGFFAAALQNRNQNLTMHQPQQQQRFPSELTRLRRFRALT